MTETTSGYSGTPLPTKLGLKDGQRVGFLALPRSLEWLTEARAFLAVARTEAELDEGGFALIHVFCTEAKRLTSSLPALIRTIAPDGMIWISWPKRASREPTDITEDTIRQAALPLGLVDVKVCAVDETWSGLKLVIRKELRQSR